MKNIMRSFSQLSIASFVSVMVVGVANADQVILDDLIVDGSACVGQDCVNGESFGFDTIRLKENNLRIGFTDTSTSASFPSNDWQLTANDSTNGGQNKFSIDDVSGGRTPFTVEASAPSHSLYVDDGGRVGLGTSTPVVEAHIVDGDTPTVRLEQDGSSGFTPQTWDMAGNETNFFVRDVTNGSTLPFKIIPSAPSDSFVINSNGNIGLGIRSPETDLHIAGSGGTTLSLDNATGNDWQMTHDDHGFLNIVNPEFPNSSVKFVNTTNTTELGLTNLDDASGGGTTWNFLYPDAGEFRITKDGTGGVELRLSTAGDLTIRGEVYSTSCGTPCAPDYVFAEDYSLMPLDTLADFIEKENHLPNVPSAEELVGPISVNKLQMTLLEKVEELTLYTLQQQERIEKLEAALAE